MNTDAIDEIRKALPPAHQKHLDPASPIPMRMMAAKGMAPLPPVEMVLVLSGLSYDSDEKLAAAAKDSLAKLPPNILGAALDKGLPGPSAIAVAEHIADDEALLEKLIASRKTPDDAIALVAAQVPQKIAEMIATDQERALRSETIVRELSKNPNILKSSLDRVFDFLVRSGVIFGDMHQFAEAMARLSPNDYKKMVESIELPPATATFLDDSNDEQLDTTALAKEAEAAINSDEEEVVAQKMPMMKLLNGLSIAEKVAFAAKGNKEARTILIRDNNKLVAGAVIRSPRITDKEIIAAAGSKSVCDEVIRIISTDKQMIRHYSVKLALVMNPKTPLPTAMKFLTLLRESDIKTIAKSKGIPSALANQARRSMMKKSQKK